MAVSRLKTWIVEVLTASDLNAEFDNVLDNQQSLGTPRTAAFDMDGQELILDADADTSITSDTDDRIDFKAAGSDAFKVDTYGALFVQGADVASASALPINIVGNMFDVTGTTTITSLAERGVGSLVVLQFDGALTLTHHATDLILPGSADITTAAGDIGVFYQYATGDWRCIAFQHAHFGTLNKVLSASATLDFPSISAQTDEELTITVTGAAANDVVAVGPPTAIEGNLGCFGYVSAADTVTVRLVNPTGGAIDPASATYRVTVFKY